MVSEEKLAEIRRRGGQYLVGTCSQMRQFKAELAKDDDWMRVRPEVKVKKIAIPQDEETLYGPKTRSR
jgi:hypothetical protein